MRFRTSVAGLACMLVGLVLPGAARAGALVPPTPVPSASGVAAAPEYFTDVWSDPMDFSNPEDLDTTPGRRLPGVTGTVANGVLDYTTTSGFGRIYVVDAEPTEMPALGHRQATARPLDPNTYRRFAFRAWTDRDVVAFLVFNHCPDGRSDPVWCQGVKAVQLRSGWHHYDLDMSGYDDWDSYRDQGNPTSVMGASWTGAPIYQLSIQPSASGVVGVHGLIDHVRVFQPGHSIITVASSRSGSQDLWYDVDADPANNGTSTAQAASAGVIRPIGTGTTTVDLGSMPPGWYRLETSGVGGFSGASAVFTVDGAPRPVVLDPDISGAGDWATEVRGNAFDFEDPFDVFQMFDGGSSVRNASVGIWGGMLHGTAAGARSDPQVFLSDASWNGPVIDASEWHRITWRIGYDGSWGTDPVAGEGLDMRFCWQSLLGQASCSKDVFPALGPVTYGVDLKTLVPSAIEPGGYSGIGWGGPASRLVQLFRLDPHEDPGDRVWHLDDVRISHDDRVPAGGAFDIRFRDDNWEQGTVADVYIDGDIGGSLGVPIVTGMVVRAGENSVPWDGSGFAPGVYGVNVVMRDPRGSNRYASSTGPIDLPDPARWGPVGTLDAATVNGRAVTVSGWVVDPDAVRSPVGVHVYVDGTGYDLGPSRLPRGDLARARSDWGPSHGYVASVPVGPGSHTVCTYGINVGHGANAGLGCRSIVVK